MRSTGLPRMAATASAGVVTDTVRCPASASAVSSSVRSSGPRAQIRIEVGGIGSRQRVVEPGEYTARVAGIRSRGLYCPRRLPPRGGVVHVPEVNSWTTFLPRPRRPPTTSQPHREEDDAPYASLRTHAPAPA